LLSSRARGKRMLFRFSNENWLGVHLGMTGRLENHRADFQPQKRDHLVFFQHQQALVFRDVRQFGRVQFHHGKSTPDWWNESVPEIADLTRAFFDRFITRHSKAPIKAVLLMQSGFSGIGNWMADEILWRAGILPGKRGGELRENEHARLYRAVRFVAREVAAHDRAGGFGFAVGVVDSPALTRRW
jgi:formamidopyrimidine-DNA glycosylase